MTNYLRTITTDPNSNLLVTAVEGLIITALILIVVFEGKGIYQNQQSAVVTVPDSPLNAQQPQNQLNNDFPALQSFQLFGREQSENQNTHPTDKRLHDAPESRLTAKITGLLAHPEDNRSLVILKHHGQQKVLRIGDTIQQTQAQILDIQPDRVLIQHQGREEIILLYPEEATRPKDIHPAVQQVAVNSTDTLEAPQSLGDLVALSSVLREQSIIGYRITPKQFNNQFFDAGFLNGDLAVAIDGYNLTNPDDAEEIIDELEFAEQATFTVNREGQLYRIELSI